MRIRTDDDIEGGAEVSMAPLIDCVFQLLIFFLVTAALKEVHKELPLDLPDAGAATKNKALDNTLIISITKDGTIHLGNEPVSQQILHQKLRQAALQQNARVRVDGDRAAAFQHIAYILDLCEFEGIKNIGVRTRD